MACITTRQPKNRAMGSDQPRLTAVDHPTWDGILLAGAAVFAAAVAAWTGDRRIDKQLAAEERRLDQQPGARPLDARAGRAAPAGRRRRRLRARRPPSPWAPTATRSPRASTTRRAGSPPFRGARDRLRRGRFRGALRAGGRETLQSVSATLATSAGRVRKLPQATHRRSEAAARGLSRPAFALQRGRPMNAASIRLGTRTSRPKCDGSPLSPGTRSRTGGGLPRRGGDTWHPCSSSHSLYFQRPSTDLFLDLRQGGGSQAVHAPSNAHAGGAATRKAEKRANDQKAPGIRSALN
jgi:hypothetical protein